MTCSLCSHHPHITPHLSLGSPKADPKTKDFGVCDPRKQEEWEEEKAIEEDTPEVTAVGRGASEKCAEDLPEFPL